MTIVYQTVTAGDSYSRSITAPNTIFFTTENLPQGLSISNSGIISGVLQQAGRFAITILARGAGGTGAAILDLTVNTPPTPFITSSDEVTHEMATAFSYQITASSPTAILSYGATSLPTGLSVNTGTGLITGTPTSASNDPVVNLTAYLSATNAAGTGYQDLLFTLPQRPVITSSLATLTLTALVPLSPYTITASKSPLTYNALPLPSGLSVNTNTGVVSGIPLLDYAAPEITFSPPSILAGQINNPGTVDGAGAAARVQIRTGTGCFDASGNYYFCQPDSVIRKVTPAGVVSTLAGVSGGTGSTNGTGSAARFNNPNSICITSNTQELFVTDQNNYTIRKITLAGVVTTFAGSPGQIGNVDGVGSAARFTSPLGIAGDSLGNLWLMDVVISGNPAYASLKKINSSASVITYESNIPVGSGGFASVACDTSNNVYYFGNNCLRRRNSANGSPTLLLGNCTQDQTDFSFYGGYRDGIGTGVRLSEVKGMGPIIDSTFGDIYFASPLQSFNGAPRFLRRITGNTDQRVVTSFPLPETDSLFGAGISKYNGLMYYGAGSSGFGAVLNTKPKTILNAGTVVSTLAGSAGSSGSTDGTGSAARFNTPAGVAIDSSGNVYVADTNNHTIRKVTPAGVVTTFAGSPGQAGNVNGTGSTARFNYPQGVTVALSGNVYVADTLNNSVRKITSSGIVTTLASLNDGLFLGEPKKLCVDSSENVYVTSSGRHMALKITSAGVVTALGRLGVSGQAGAYGIGQLGIQAVTSSIRVMDTPIGIACGGVDQDGRTLFYVTESGNAIISLFKINVSVSTDTGQTEKLLIGQPPRVIIGSNNNYTVAGKGSTDGTGSTSSLPVALITGDSGIAIGPSDLLFICDQETNVIRAIKNIGSSGYAVTSTLAGKPGVVGSADGTGVENVSFSGPSDICFYAPTQTLYVCEKGNHTIRKILLPPGISTSTPVILSASNSQLTGTATKTINVNP